jgi:hypothetical protein
MRTLWIIIGALLAIWLIGVVINIVGTIIHLVLIVAVILVAVALLRPRRF